MTLHSEIFEQPERLASLLDHQKQAVLEIAKAIQSRNVQYAFLAARGTSDNAGRYANYLWGAHNGIPLALATPSLFTYYQTPPRLNNALVVGVSQSAQVKDGLAYPAVLIAHGINDQRVAPWMSAKMTARLQAATSSNKPILLRIDYDAGHGVGLTRQQRNREVADIFAFLFQQLGNR